jgi:hypothetical protein
VGVGIKDVFCSSVASFNVTKLKCSIPYNFSMKLDWIGGCIDILSIDLAMFQLRILSDCNICHIESWIIHTHVLIWVLYLKFYILGLTSWIWTSPSTERLTFESPSKWISYGGFNLEHWAQPQHQTNHAFSLADSSGKELSFLDCGFTRQVMLLKARGFIYVILFPKFSR